MFQELDLVRIVCLDRDQREFSGSAGVQRPPEIGDTGTIVHAYDPSAATAAFIVESVAADGTTNRLADFTPDELELVIPYRPHR